MKAIRKSKFTNWRGRVLMVVIHLATLVDTVVFFATLSFYTSDLRPRVVFSEWAEHFENKGE